MAFVAEQRWHALKRVSNKLKSNMNERDMLMRHISGRYVEAGIIIQPCILDNFPFDLAARTVRQKDRTVHISFEYSC